LKLIIHTLILIPILCFNVYAQGIWTNYTNGNDINDIAIEGDYIWCATSCGVVRWDKRYGTYTKYTVADGLIHNEVHSVAIDAGVITPGSALLVIGGFMQVDVLEGDAPDMGEEEYRNQDQPKNKPAHPNLPDAQVGPGQFGRYAHPGIKQRCQQHPDHPA